MPTGPKPNQLKTNDIAVSEAPAWLPPDVLPTWEAIVPLAAGEIALGRVDIVGLADLCVCLHRMSAAELVISELGVTVEDRDGFRRKNPAVQIARDYRTSLQAWCKMYGWTPVHRKQVKKATLEAEKPDFLAAALERVNENRPVQ